MKRFKALRRIYDKVKNRYVQAGEMIDIADDVIKNLQNAGVIGEPEAEPKQKSAKAKE